MGINATVICMAAIIAAACGSTPEDVTATNLSLAPEAGGPAVTGFVSGSAHWNAGELWTTYELHARIMPSGAVEGTWQSRRHLGPQGGAKRHGRITCLVIEGNQAWLGGVIEKAINPDLIGHPIGFRVIDNGEGTEAAPDLFAVTLDLPSAAQYCADQPETALTALEAGGLQVHKR